jgi:hypothetical protein
MIVVDIASKANRIHDFDHARVNENATDNQTYDATEDIARGEAHCSPKKKTPNVQRPTSNAQWQNQFAALGVEC